MKKISVVIAALCAVLIIAGCASAPSASDGMSGARKNAPGGVLVGMASEKGPKEAAETAAKLQLARAMHGMVRNMVQSDTAAGKISADVASDFQQSMIVTLTRSKMDGATKQASGVGSGNMGWAVFYMEKSDVAKEINAAAATAKGAYPAASGFTVEDKIDAEFSAAAAKDWKN